MADPAPTTTSAPPAPADEAMPCPGCGYDLRAAPTDVCSECGLKVDPAMLRESGFPWAHRRKIGRVKAYVLTVWRVTIGSRKLAYEAFRPQKLTDGRRFMAVTCVLVVGVVFGAFLVAVLSVGRSGLASVAYGARDGLRSVPKGWEGLEWDIAVPWSAGAALWPTWGCIALLALSLTRLPRAVIRPKRGDPRRERIQSIACYLCAPVAFLCLSPALRALSAFLRYGQDHHELDVPCDVLLVCAAAWPFFVLLATAARTGHWMARTTQCGFFRGLLAAFELAGLWLLSALALLGVVPWCVGMVWMAVNNVGR